MDRHVPEDPKGIQGHVHVGGGCHVGLRRVGGGQRRQYPGAAAAHRTLERDPLVDRSASATPAEVWRPDGVRALSSDDVWAVGYQKVAGDVQPFAEHYDGTAWKVVQVPVPPGTTQAVLTDVAGDAPNNVWGVGTSLGRTRHPLIEHWDGSQWHRERAQVTGGDMAASGVAVAASDHVWVVGNTRDRQPVFSHWDGSNFHQVRVKAGTELITGVWFISASIGMAVGLTTTRRSGHRIVIPAHLQWNSHYWHDQDLLVGYEPNRIDLAPSICSTASSCPPGVRSR